MLILCGVYACMTAARITVAEALQSNCALDWYMNEAAMPMVLSKLKPSAGITTRV